MRVVVTGGRGSLGHLVVPLLKDVGHEVVTTTRNPRDPNEIRVDLSTGEGLEAALDGADRVIHLASDPRHAKAVDIGGTERLVAALSPETQLIYVSIVGIDEHPFPYYQAKRQAETMIEARSGPWTILRATQFHSLFGQFIDQLSWLPILPVPGGTLFQPIDPAVVARRVVDLVESGAQGRVPDLGGPERIDTLTLTRDYLRAAGKRRLCIPVRYPGRAAAAFRSGVILTENKAQEGRTWGEWLEEAS